MSQGAINIDHSRARRLVAKPQRRLYLRSDQKKKDKQKRREEEEGKMKKESRKRYDE